MKEYLISGKRFGLVEYGNLTPQKEKEINELFGFNNGDKEIKIDIKPDKIFPLILVPIDHNEPIDPAQITYNQMIEIICDYKEAMQSFFEDLSQRLSPS